MKLTLAYVRERMNDLDQRRAAKVPYAYRFPSLRFAVGASRIESYRKIGKRFAQFEQRVANVEISRTA